MKRAQFILLATLSIFLYGSGDGLPSIQISRNLDLGGKENLSVRCEEDSTVNEKASCWLTLARTGKETLKKNLRMHEVEPLMKEFFQRISHRKQDKTRVLTSQRIAFTWNISSGAHFSKGEMAFGDGSENNTADAVLSVEFLLSSKFLTE